MKQSQHSEAVIIGAGLSGICAAIRLREAGFENIPILEKAQDVGGTWRENRYPGVACDVPSHLYSYSFAPNPDWSRWYAPGAEICHYVRKCAVDFRVHDQIVFDTTVESAVWNGDHWVLRDSRGAVRTTTTVISALGGLHTPNVPDLPGMTAFEGTIFHTTDWPEDIDLKGKRVAVVGTGATAVQVVPEIADEVSELFVFQRNPVWVGLKRDPEYTEEQRREFRDNPAAMKRHRDELYESWETTSVELHRLGSPLNRKAARKAREMIERSVSDPALVQSLTPDHNFTCKRPTVSDRYYAAYDKDNVTLVTGAVEGLTSSGVTTSNRTFDVDVIVLATGFKPFNITNQMAVTGADGLALADAWQDEVRSYRTVMVHGFPNLFLMMGPNGTGLQSALQQIEAQAGFVTQALQQMQLQEITSLNPRRACVDTFTHDVRERFARSTHSKGCRSWWSDATGYNHSIWPGSSDDYRALLADLDLSEFHVTGKDPGRGTKGN